MGKPANHMEGIRIQTNSLLPAADTQEGTVLVNAKMIAPILQSDRIPLSVVCSVDRSGSMSGDKMKLVKSTLRFLVSQLTQRDRFGLVVWSDDVTVQLEPVAMDETGRGAALEAIEAFETQGCTNLSGGLLSGIQTLVEDTPHVDGPRTSAVLLLTDGLANRGVTEQEPLVDCCRGAIEAGNMAVPPSVFTFGFGADHNPDMLRAISDAGSGLYYYLESKEAIPQTFADCLGGLLSVVGQNLKLVLEPLNGSSIAEVLTKYSVQQSDDGTSTVKLGDLYSEENRNVLIELKIPAVEPNAASPLVAITLKYFDTVLAKPMVKDAVFNIDRCEALPAAMVEDAEVAMQHGRWQAAKAMEEANALGRSGKYAEGQRMIKQVQERLEGMRGNEELVNDLSECLVGLQDRESYRSSGSKKLMNYSCEAHYERSCTFGIERQQTYQTSRKTEMCSKAALWERPANSTAPATLSSPRSAPSIKENKDRAACTKAGSCLLM